MEAQQLRAIAFELFKSLKSLNLNFIKKYFIVFQIQLKERGVYICNSLP